LRARRNAAPFLFDKSMSLPHPTFDQLQVMLAVVEEGSFSGAARRLNRAQSAVTYAIQRLEEELGAALFDRASYRASLTEAGRSLLPRARLIAEEMRLFCDQAQGISEGLEPELTLVVEAMFPMDVLTEALRAFGARFPSVPPRLYVESLGAAAERVLNGDCALGLLLAQTSQFEALTLHPLLDIRLIRVAAPCHPLARMDQPVAREDMRREVQLVVTDRSALTGPRDYGVISTQTWRLADLGAKHAMLLAGLGWGSMPEHLVAADLAAGRLKRICARPPREEGTDSVLPDDAIVVPLCAAHRRIAPPGPAGRWFLQRLQDRLRPGT
jgi:DNA-binding transcriptional LysR family regulator